MSFSAALLDFAISIIHTIGYAGIGLLLAVATIGVPIPSEAVLVLAGAAVRTGTYQLWFVLALGIVMQTAGCIIAYYIGSYGGSSVIKKYGKYVFVSEEDYKKTQQWFAKHGSKAIVVSLLIPVVRAFIGLVAGTNKVELKQFVLQCLLGSTVWTVAWVLVGMLLGNSWRDYYAYMHYVDYLVVVVILGFVGRFFWKRYSNRSTSGATRKGRSAS